MLAALPGMDPGRLDDDPGATRAAAAERRRRCWQCSAPAQPLGTISGSKAVRVTARIAFDSGQRVTSEAVIFILDSGSDAYRVLTWRDDIDDAPADAAQQDRDPMTGLGDIKVYLARWIDSVAAAIVGAAVRRSARARACR